MDSPASQSVVLITGASNGLGKALAIVYAKAGHALLLTGRDPIALQETVTLAEQAGVLVYSFAQDLSSQDAVDNIMNYITAKQLNIGILINNAGIAGIKEADYCTEILHYTV